MDDLKGYHTAFVSENGMHKSQEGQDPWKFLFTVKAGKLQKSGKTRSQVGKQNDNANGKSESWIYRAKNCAEGKVARIFALVKGIIVQNTGRDTVEKQ